VSFPTNCFRHPRQERHSCREQSRRSAQLQGHEQSRRVKERRAGQLGEKQQQQKRLCKENKKEKNASGDKNTDELEIAEEFALGHPVYRSFLLGKVSRNSH